MQSTLPRLHAPQAGPPANSPGQTAPYPFHQNTTHNQGLPGHKQALQRTICVCLLWFSSLKRHSQGQGQVLNTGSLKQHNEMSKFTGQHEYTQEHTGKYIESSCANSHFTEEPNGELDLLATVKLFLRVSRVGGLLSVPH